IIEACIRLGLFDDFREAGFVSAGRTDAGVSARGQVIALSTVEPERAVSTLNRVLPADCWCTGWAIVPDHFNPRYRAESRTYRYLFTGSGLDLEAMKEASGYFIGVHNFSRIARVEEGRDPTRKILRTKIWMEDDSIIFEVVGESFLWHMVRGMATLLQAVGTGLISPDRVRTILNEPGGRIPAAPADSLILWDVECGLSYHPIPISEKAKRWLSEEKRRCIAEKRMISWLGGDRPDIFREEEIHDKLGHLL
ncbi:tRNA pseudouridine(38-40) synthase TruA, partial [Methanocalculus sp.]|uniref:tRNA pseudouridine(38-40) synthase TruA n=1 Tax=Methanocalculus sp. TaxID=2004547 RepID=UPI0027285BCA